MYSYDGERIWKFAYSVVESSDVCYCAEESTSRKNINVYQNYATTIDVSYRCYDPCGNIHTVTLQEEIPPLKPTWSSVSSTPAPYQIRVRAGNTTDFIHCSCEPF
jgi:hypothetical protein